MRALVLSGGGAHGAYEVGALRWLLGQREMKYDLYCGISVGALNCAILSMFPQWQEKAAIRALQNIWLEITDNASIFKEHTPFGRVMSFWRKSIVNSQPLLSLIDKHFDPVKTLDAKRQLIVGAVSLTSGKYIEFNERNIYIHDAVKASAAYPVFFNPIFFDKQLWADGGIKTIAPLKAAVLAGATHIDCIITAPADSPVWLNKKPNTLDIALRVLELTYEEVLDDDLATCLKKHSEVKITVLRPLHELPGTSVAFSSKNRIVMDELGYKDAQARWPATA